MGALTRAREAFKARGALVVIVGPDDAAAFRSYWAEHDMPFVGLADPDHVAADLYAQEVNPLKLGRMPALFVIDRAGIVRYVHYGADMTDIPSNEEVLGVLDGLPPEETS